MEASDYRILIVDDDPAITDLLASYLASQGYFCETATNGRTALEMVVCRHFDIAITDVVMAGMDGIALTKQLSRQFPNLLIMVMSGYYDVKTTESAFAAGAHEFIRKPFTLAELDMCFQRMIQNKTKHKEGL